MKVTKDYSMKIISLVGNINNKIVLIKKQTFTKKWKE